MIIRHEFEDADTGNEKLLDPDCSYDLVETIVEREVFYDETVTFTHRVRMRGFKGD